MKTSQFKFLAYLFNVMVLLVIGTTLLGYSHTLLAGSLVVAMATGTVLSLESFKGLSFMAIQVEIWQNHIEKEIFKDNMFLRYSHNADANVINSKVVHIPQSGGSGNVVKNRSQLPATVRKRTDTDVIYLLDEYTTDPVLIPNADKHELSYDKRSSVLGEDQDKLVQTTAEETLLNWVRTPAYGTYSATEINAGRIFSTTGANVAATAPGATGTRKAARLSDLQKIKTFFRRENRWVEGKMYGLLTPDMEAELFPPESEITAKYMQSVTEAERREGVIYKVQGFKLMTRSSVYRLLADGSILPPEALGAATDDEASLFWYEKSVEYAFGGVTAFQDQGKPEYYGDVYSFLVRSGGRARRKDYSGIALLKQGKTA